MNRPVGDKRGLGIGFAALLLCGFMACSANQSSPAAAVGGGGARGIGDAAVAGRAGNDASAQGGDGGMVVDGGLPPDAGGAPNALADGGVPPGSNRVDTVLDDSWRFIKKDVPTASMSQFDDSSWGTVTLPHTWNAADAQVQNYYRGPGWYRRHYQAPKEYAGRRIYLQFDAANTVADVFVNGTHVGQHRGGYSMFRFDVTSLVALGADNIIAVKVDNTAFTDVGPLNSDFTMFGGIYRDVHVLVTDPVHVDVLDYSSPGVFVTPKNVSAATADLDVRVELVNDDTMPHAVDVEADVVDASGAVVKTLTMPQTLMPTPTGTNTSVTLSTTIGSPHLWNGRADPYLYRVQVLVKEAGVVRDAVSQPLGFRFYSFDANTGFSLNGQHLDLHGVNCLQERQWLGWALTSKELGEDMALIQEVGATVIRGSQYEHAELWNDLADKNGILMWAELDLIFYSNPSASFHQNMKQQFLELIRQSYNHPSIFVWGMSNEPQGADTTLMLKELQAVAHVEDPSRPTTIADNVNFKSATGNWDPDSAIPDQVGFNHYGGWYGDVATDIGPYTDSLHQQKPTKAFGISEYGAGASIHFHSATPVVMDHTEEYQNYFHETYWAALSARPFIWCKIIWSMFDFSSPTRNEGDTPGLNDKGLLTHDHQKKKDSFFFYKANWTTAPVVYITSRRWTPRPAGTVDIKVYANTDSVELTLNGKSLGSKTSTNHVFVWTGATLNIGSNTAQAKGTTAGTVVSVDAINWTGM